MSKLGDNPLFSNDDIDLIKQAEKQIPRTTTRVYTTDPTLEDYTRMTFIVKKELLDKLRDYAYTERLDLKQAINIALESFLNDKNDLLKAPEKPKQTRTKRG